MSKRIAKVYYRRLTLAFNRTPGISDMILHVRVTSPRRRRRETNTVRVTNVSAKATAHDIHDFFSFSGEIENIDMHRDGDTQIALVTFKEAQALDTALLLSGATVVDRAVNISPVEDELSPSMNSVPREQMFGTDAGSSRNPNQAVEVISTMLAKGFVLGKDAVSKAKEFDEKHDLSASAKSSVVNFDKNTGISEKLSAGTAVVNQHVKAVDEKFQVSEKTRAALAVAEEKVATAGSALMKNRYILTGATWVTGAFSRVQKAAAEVSQKAKEKATAMETEQGKGPEETHSSEFADSFGASRPYPAAEIATLGPTSQYPNLGYDHYSPLHSTDPRSTRTPSTQGLML